MSIEEITLSVPGSLPAHQQDSDASTDSSVEIEKKASAHKLARAYFKSARARDRFAFTTKGRARNRERFAQSLKAIVKRIATDGSSPIKDRSARMAVRTQVYADVMQLAKAMSDDQRAMIRRSRLRLYWSLALATAGILAIGLSLVINDMVIW